MRARCHVTSVPLNILNKTTNRLPVSKTYCHAGRHAFPMCQLCNPYINNNLPTLYKLVFKTMHLIITFRMSINARPCLFHIGKYHGITIDCIVFALIYRSSRPQTGNASGYNADQSIVLVSASLALCRVHTISPTATRLLRNGMSCACRDV